MLGFKYAEKEGFEPPDLLQSIVFKTTGACRQTLSEYEINQKEPFPVIFMGEVGEIVKTPSLLSLLPFSFDSSYL